MTQPKEFNKSDVERAVIHDLSALRIIKDSFIYVHTMLTKQGHSHDLGVNSSPDFDKLNWSEGKSYQWLAMSIGDTDGSTEFLIRQYRRHLTVFTKLSYSDQSYKDVVYGSFTFNSNNDKMSYAEREASDLNENFFHEFQIAFPHILRLVNENALHSLWNNINLPRPAFVDVQTAFYGEQIRSIDLLIFCAEELTQKHMELFAENDMLDMLKALPNVVGLEFGQGIISQVRTEFPKQYSEPYYHGVGLVVREREDYTRIYDVYTLCRYHLEDLMALLPEPKL